MLLAGALLTRDILDYEFKNSYELIVRATDAVNRTFTQALVIVSVEVSSIAALEMMLDAFHLVMILQWLPIVQC